MFGSGVNLIPRLGVSPSPAILWLASPPCAMSLTFPSFQKRESRTFRNAGRILPRDQSALSATLQDLRSDPQSATRAYDVGVTGARKSAQRGQVPFLMVDLREVADGFRAVFSMT